MRGYIKPNPKVLPLTPEQVIKTASESIPSDVIEVVNSLLVAKSAPYLSKQNITIRKREITDAYTEKVGPNGLEFKLQWLNFEKLYEQHGWKVVYEGPSIGDSFQPFYRFTQK